MSGLDEMLEGLKSVTEGIKQVNAVLEAEGQLSKLSNDIRAVWKEVNILPDDSLHKEYKDSVSKLNKWAVKFGTIHLKNLREKCTEAVKLFEKIHIENDASVTNDDVQQMVKTLESTVDVMSRVSKLLRDLKPLLETSEKEAEFIMGKREEEAKKLKTEKSENSYSGYAKAGAVAVGAVAIGFFAAPVAVAATGVAVLAGSGMSCSIGSHTYKTSADMKKEADDLESKAEHLRQQIGSIKTFANSMDGAVKFTDDAVKALRSALLMYQRDMQKQKELEEKEKENQKLKEVQRETEKENQKLREKLREAGIDISSD